MQMPSRVQARQAVAQGSELPSGESTSSRDDGRMKIRAPGPLQIGKLESDSLKGGFQRTARQVSPGMLNTSRKMYCDHGKCARKSVGQTRAALDMRKIICIKVLMWKCRCSIV